MAVYKQTQHTAPLIRWGLLVLVTLIVLGSLLAGLLKGEYSGDDWIAIPIAVLALGIALGLLLTTRLELRVDAREIRYRMYPLEWKDRTISREEIRSLEVFTLPKFPVYGGYGRRRKPWKKEIAYILSWKTALRVRLNDGKVRVFSLDRPDALRKLLRTEYADLLENDSPKTPTS